MFNKLFPKNKKGSAVVSVLVFLVLAAGVGLTVYLVRQQQIYKSRASTTVQKLYVAISPANVTAGGTYTITVKDTNSSGVLTPYVGTLASQVTFCPAATPTNCSLLTTGQISPAGGVITTNSSGVATITVPATAQNGTYKLRFKPKVAMQ